ncbi:MAG: TerB family tellurite resistance protein [Desulfobulbaceae bacterium]|nr:TerB family tellurite resistance protein [Desulfobulbaceae bacterium]
MSADSVRFMANIIQVAYADGKLSGTEQAAIENARKELGIKKGDVTAAQKMVDTGSYVMKPVGSFSDQVRNLEYALRVAYADGDLGSMESEMIMAYGVAIGLTQVQLERMREEVMVQATAALRCPSCGAETPADSRFCSKCGNNISVADEEVQVKYEIPRSGITIEFAESTGASFPKALELAKKASSFQQGTKNKKTWFMAHFASGAIVDATPLAEALGGLRNRSLYIDGKEQQWDEVFAFVWCSSQRGLAYRPVEYCFGKDDNRINPWGCKQARMEWTEWANWFCYGQWEKSGFIGRKTQWRFDKNRIKHELSTNIYKFRYCPYLNAKLLELVLQGIPDIVAPNSESDWDYHQNYREVPGAIRIVKQERSSGMTFTNEFWADGVRPKGLKVFAEILFKAFTEMKTDLSPIKALIK